MAAPAWLAVTVAVVGLVVAVPAKVVDERLRQLSAVAESVRRGCSAVDASRVGRYRDDELVPLGVQAAGLPEGAAVDDSRPVPRIPGYVQRDQHEVLASKLCAGRFVIVLGDSAAGKSRLALEVMRATVPGHRMFAPAPSALADTIEEMCRVRAAVLWLDDLDRFFETDALTTNAVDRLLSGKRHQRMTVATVRSKAHDNLLTKGEGVRAGALADRLRVLDMAEPVRVGRHFSEAEVARAGELTTDVRIVDALAHARESGLAEYLSVGPQLRNRWLDGKETDPRGVALVLAALDCRRAGYISPLPVAMLDEVHVHYLPDTTRYQDLEAAWHWAKQRVRHTTALLEPVGDGTAVNVVDYLIDHVQHTTPVDADPPADVLTSALTYSDAMTATAIGTHAYYRGRYRLALAAHTRALAERKAKKGFEHHETLMSRGSLALTLASLGRLDEAEQENRTALAGLVDTLGEAHVDTLTSRSNLAFVLACRWKLADAEKENRIALAGLTRQMGATHPETLTSRSYLALVLLAQGKRTEAEATHHEVIEARSRVLGAEHLVLWAQGKLDAAEEENRAVLDALVRVSGPVHPHTLTSRNNLAMVLRARGDLNGAEEEMRAVVDARTCVLGPNHPGTLKSRSNLASVLRAQGKLDAAEEANRVVLAARLAVLGPTHPDTLISRNNLALVFAVNNKIAEAGAEHEKVLAERIRTLGENHPDTVASREHLATVRRMDVSST